MIISVLSGKGGTGKTTIAVNLALAAGKGVYIDCDVEEPNGFIFLKPQISEKTPVEIEIPSFDREKCAACGECAQKCRFHAIALVKGKLLFFPELCHSCGLCQLVCGQRAIGKRKKAIGMIEKGFSGNIAFAQGILNVGERSGVPVIKRLREETGAGELIVRDCPPGSSCSVMEAVEGSDYAIIVTEPTPFGLHDMKIAVELLRYLQIPFGVIINKWGEGDGMIEDVCEKEGIPIISKVPFSREIARSYSKGDTLEKSAYMEYFVQAMQRIKELVKE
jgi:MinD superfamily P-loop ATPase